MGKCLKFPDSKHFMQIKLQPPVSQDVNFTNIYTYTAVCKVLGIKYRRKQTRLNGNVTEEIPSNMQQKSYLWLFVFRKTHHRSMTFNSNDAGHIEEQKTTLRYHREKTTQVWIFLNVRTKG